MATAEQRRRALLSLHKVLQHYDYIRFFCDAYFVHRRNRDECAASRIEGQWRDAHFPTLVAQIAVLSEYADGDERELAWAAVKASGNEAVERIFAEFVLDLVSQNHPLAPLFRSTAADMREMWIKIKSWLRNWMSAGEGAFARASIIKLLKGDGTAADLSRINIVYSELVPIVQQIERRAMEFCRNGPHGVCWWRFWNAFQALCLSSSATVEAMGGVLGRFARGSGCSMRLLEQKAICAAMLDRSKGCMDRLSRGLAHKFVDRGKGCIKSDKARNEKRRKDWSGTGDKTVGRVPARRRLGRVSKDGVRPKFCQQLIISEDEIRYGK